MVEVLESLFLSMASLLCSTTSLYNKSNLALELLDIETSALLRQEWLTIASANRSTSFEELSASEDSEVSGSLDNVSAVYRSFPGVCWMS